MPLIIVGLDGADFKVLDALIADGHMPHLGRIAASGLRAELHSTLPVATLPAWASFLTACEPARHGVADLFVREGYRLRAATGMLRSEPTWMARLSAKGMAVACLGMPGTFPPRQAGGWCVAGFDAPGLRGATPEAVWPPELYSRLQRHGGWRYATFNEHQKGTQRLRPAVDALLADIAVKERIIVDLLRERPWDVFCVHLQASDTAAHHLWHTWDRSSPRYAPGHCDLLPRVYQRLDTLIGRLRAAAPPESRFMIVSDHGMGGADTLAVHLNAYLQQQGLLQFATSPRHLLGRTAGTLLRRALQRAPGPAAAWAVRATPAALLARAMQAARGAAVDFSRTQAFSDELDYSPSIWLNRRGVFAQGIVDASQADTLCQSITEALLRLRHPHSGEALIARVHRRAELPPGPHAERLPDLLIEPAWCRGYRPSFLPSHKASPAVRRLRFDEYSAGKGAGMPGVHRRAGVFLACGPGVPARSIAPLGIAQAGALVYSLAGVPTPRDVDATVPAELLQLLGSAGPTTFGESAEAYDPYTAAESAELLERLADMGYI